MMTHEQIASEVERLGYEYAEGMMDPQFDADAFRENYGVTLDDDAYYKLSFNDLRDWITAGGNAYPEQTCEWVDDAEEAGFNCDDFESDWYSGVERFLSEHGSVKDDQSGLRNEKREIYIFLNEFLRLLVHRPELACLCNFWEAFSGNQLSSLFSKRPELGRYCKDWQVLDREDWTDLLKCQPQLAFNCNQWDDFGSRNWFVILSEQPSLSAHLKKWDIFQGRWGELLVKQPALYEKCSAQQWKTLDTNEWVGLLKAQPGFAQFCDKWGLFTPNNWVSLLCIHPDFAGKCDAWKLFTDYDWVTLLCVQPQFSRVKDICWKSFSTYQWLRLLHFRPEFRHLCDEFKGLGDYDFDCLRVWNPMYDYESKKWEDFSKYSWVRILKEYPEYVDKCNKIHEFGAALWVDLLKSQPQFAERCDKWNEMNGSCWADLLSAQPQFAHLCPYNDNPHDDEEFGENIGEAEELPKSLTTNHLSWTQWVDIMIEDPNLVSECPLGEFLPKGLKLSVAETNGGD